MLLQCCVLVFELGGMHSRGSGTTMAEEFSSPGLAPEDDVSPPPAAPPPAAPPPLEMERPRPKRRLIRPQRNGSSPFYRSDQIVTRDALPNVVMMVADDMQPRDLGLGYTPQIESIGRRGLAFGNAHTPGPLCTPSRYAMLTGRHPSCHFASRGGAGRTGGRAAAPMVQQIGLDGTSALLPDLQPIEFNINLPLRARANASSAALAAELTPAGDGNGGGAPVDDRAQCTVPTIATLLRERGYATGIFGKWHLGYPAMSVTPSERARIVGAAPSQWKGVKRSVLGEYRAVQAHVRRCGFDVAERLYVNNLYAEQHVLPSSMLYHNLEWIAEGARTFMTKPRRGPFFAYIGWTLPHNPEVLVSLQADPRYTPGGLWGANRDEVLAKRAAVCAAANVSTEALIGTTDERASRKQPMPMSPGVGALPRFGHRHYPLALAWLDSGVGAVLSAMRDVGLEDNTLTIFTSDHAAYDKGHCYSGGSRIPMMLQWPLRIVPRAATAPLPHLVSHLDLLPTILHAANVHLGDAAEPPSPPLPSEGGSGDARTEASTAHAATGTTTTSLVTAADGAIAGFVSAATANAPTDGIGGSDVSRLPSRSAPAGGEPTAQLAGPPSADLTVQLASRLSGRSLAPLLVGSAAGELHPEHAAWQVRAISRHLTPYDGLLPPPPALRWASRATSRPTMGFSRHLPPYDGLLPPPPAL